MKITKVETIVVNMPMLIKGAAPIDAATATGATALMLAAAAGKAEIVSALAAAGADPNRTETAHGQTALMFAASLGRTEAVKALFDGQAALDGPESGADVLAPLWFKRDGSEPIHPLEAS